MKTETIINPDAQFIRRSWENYRPVFSHVEVVHHPLLKESDNLIISRLLETGFEVHKTVSTFYMGFPTADFKLDRHFRANVRDEFQMRLGDDGWLRFRFEVPGEMYLTLFYINYEKQGKGKGRVLFPQVTEALFKAGARSLRGEVAPSWCRSQWEMNVERLTRFYLRQGFTKTGDGYIVKKSPYEVGRSTGNIATARQSEAAAVLQS